jgi:hypothetical protein
MACPFIEWMSVSLTYATEIKKGRNENKKNQGRARPQVRRTGPTEQADFGFGRYAIASSAFGGCRKAHIAVATAAIIGNFRLQTSWFADTTSHVNKKADCLFVRCTGLTDI